MAGALTRLTALTSLDARRNFAVDVPSFAALAEGCTRLRELRLPLPDAAALARLPPALARLRGVHVCCQGGCVECGVGGDEEDEEPPWYEA